MREAFFRPIDFRYTEENETDEREGGDLRPD
jgi:hypothetical protein